MRTMQRVREGVKLRLEMNIPYIGTIQLLMLESFAIVTMVNMPVLFRHLGTGFKHPVSAKERSNSLATASPGH